MKKKISITILFVLFIITAVSAQIENEINNFVDSTEITLNNGRKFLAKSIQDGNLQKSQEVFHYLMMKGEEKNCWSFSFKEQLLLSVVFRDWSGLLLKMENYTEQLPYLCYSNLVPVEDAIYAELRKILPEIENDNGIEKIEREDKELLKILFQLINVGSKNDEYDELLKNFKKNYPQSKYNNFIKDYLPAPKYKASISYSIGPKFSFLSGNFSDYFKNSTGFSFAMDFCISKVYVSMYMEVTSTKLLRPITLTNKNGVTHNFGVDESFIRSDIGLKTGYYLIRNNHIHLAPYATLLAGGFMESNLYEYESDTNKEYSIYDSFTPGVGVHFEYKLGGYKGKTIYPYYSIYGLDNSGYFSLKMDVGFVPIPKFDYLQAKGGMSYITLGLVWGIGVF